MDGREKFVKLAQAQVAARQPESGPLVEPFLAWLDANPEGWAPTDAPLLATMTGTWLTGLHGMLLIGGRVDLVELRAQLDRALEAAEVLLVQRTPAVREGDHLTLRRPAGEVC